MPATASPIFGGIPSFRVKDELYLHERRQDIEVHFFAQRQGQEVPIVWTHLYGQGRVCYAVPGHCAATMQNTIYRQVIERGLAWVTPS
jgi:type 1 glutamine amidotransferase